MPKYAPLEQGDPTSLGAYEVVGRLGVGGQGAVYLGRTAGGEHVAIKLLHAQMNADPQARARFVREVAAAQKVEPFCTARVIEAQVDGEQPYVVSEYIDGPSLHELVATQGPRPAQELNLLAIGMLTALAAIHEVGIVHRDFKPNNVLIAADGPRVVDFGIARTVNSQESAVTATGMVVGTPGYLAPEQLTGAPLQPSVDIFAFGATMIFAATGQSPFEAETLPVIINRILNDDPDLSGLPPELRPLISGCLAKDPARRPSALEALLQLVPPAGGGAATPGQREELLNEGTRIAAQLPVPPPPRTPAPAPFAPPGQPPAQPYAAAPGTVSPQPFQQPGQPGTPPPFQQSGFQPGIQHGQPGFQPAPSFQPPTPPPFQPGGPGGPGQGFPPGPGTHGAFAPPPPGPPARRSNGPAIAAIGCSVLLILVLLIAIVAVVSDKDDDPLVSPTNGTTTEPSQQRPPQQNDSAACDPQPSDTTFCSDYAGTWTGVITQVKPSSGRYQVTIVIQEGSSTGQVTYANAPGADTTWSCTGTLTFLHHTPDATYKTVVRENITQKNNAKCDSVSYDELFPKSSNKNEMFFTNFFTQEEADEGGDDYSAIGTLTRQ
ncbi:serine/threonine-protein kinase [Actinocorallia libanotica]|uniref:non-specific serine/threonine protein kinase n=1 Tax=Actinocorallia libanotica TaxID=46162 RepID=A0ABN1RV49_9ACTN